MKRRKLLVGALMLGAIALTACGENGDSTISVTPTTNPVESTPSQTTTPTPTHEHTYATDWSRNQESHWHSSECGHDVKKDFGEHTYTEWETLILSSCKEKGSKTRSCTICGWEQNEAINASHTFENGVCTVCGIEEPTEGLEYRIFDDYCYVSGASDYVKENVEYIILPDIYDGKPVTAIEHDAFKSFTNLKGIIIPEGIKVIGSHTFDGCTNLVSITIPKSVKYINPYAFSGCESLSNVTLPDGLEEIEYGVFENCNRLISVTLPNTVTSIKNFAFNGCIKLYEIINLSDLTIEKGSLENGAVGYNALNIKTEGTTDIVTKDIFQFYNIDGKDYLINAGNFENIILPMDFNGKKYDIYDMASDC